MAKLTWTSPVAKCLWADVIAPKYNDEYKTTKYSVGIVVPNDAALPLLELVQQAMDDYMRTNPRFGEKVTPRIPVAPSMVQVEGSSEKVEDPDNKLVTFSTNGLTKNGQTAPAPALWDCRGIAIPSGTILEIPFGSDIRVVSDIYVYDKGATSQGVALGLQGIQIARLAERVQAPGAIEGLEDGFTIDSPGAIGNGAAPAAAAAPAAPAARPSALDLLRRS